MHVVGAMHSIAVTYKNEIILFFLFINSNENNQVPENVVLEPIQKHLSTFLGSSIETKS